MIKDYGSYFFVDDRRVIVFTYGNVPNTNKYRYAYFDNFVDHPSEDVDEKELQEVLKNLMDCHELYNANKYNPESIHALLKDKVSRTYGVKWFHKNYAIFVREIKGILSMKKISFQELNIA